MDIQTLRKCGEALYGNRWQMPLARALRRPGCAPGVDISLVQRWLSEERPLPHWIRDAVVELLDNEKAAHISKAQQLSRISSELQFTN